MPRWRRRNGGLTPILGPRHAHREARLRRALRGMARPPAAPGVRGRVGSFSLALAGEARTVVATDGLLPVAGGGRDRGATHATGRAGPPGARRHHCAAVPGRHLHQRFDRRDPGTRGGPKRAAHELWRVVARTSPGRHGAGGAASVVGVGRLGRAGAALSRGGDGRRCCARPGGSRQVHTWGWPVVVSTDAVFLSRVNRRRLAAAGTVDDDAQLRAVPAGPAALAGAGVCGRSSARPPV